MLTYGANNREPINRYKSYKEDKIGMVDETTEKIKLRDAIRRLNPEIDIKTLNPVNGNGVYDDIYTSKSGEFLKLPPGFSYDTISEKITNGENISLQVFPITKDIEVSLLPKDMFYYGKEENEITSNIQLRDAIRKLNPKVEVKTLNPEVWGNGVYDTTYVSIPLIALNLPKGFKYDVNEIRSENSDLSLQVFPITADIKNLLYNENPDEFEQGPRL